MARTSLEASRETDGNFTSWLLRSSSISANELGCVIRLRSDGFYAGHTTMEELKSFCLRNFNPHRVSLKPEARLLTKGDDDAGAETRNLRSDLREIDFIKDKILKVSIEKDISDKQKHVLGTDISEGNCELQASLCLPSSEEQRTAVVQSQSGDEPCTVSDHSKDARQVFPEFHVPGGSSGDDTKFVPNFVDCFYVTDMNNEAVSLFNLPYESTASREESPLQRFFIHGMYDNGLHPIVQAVTTWKLELGQKSYFFVKTSTGKWIRLGRPNESYAATQLRTALVVKKFLSFVNLNQAASEEEVWSHLQKKFRLSEVQPSLDDLLQHTKFIKKFLKEIPQLDHSMVVRELFRKRKATSYIHGGDKENLRKKSKTFNCFDKEEIRSKHSLEDKESKGVMASILDSEEPGMDLTEELDESDEKELGETVCAICDDGGDILCCDGPCLRSFHATEAAAAKSTSGCVSLHFTENEVKEMRKFFCWNCQYKQHQCFICGHLGLSEGEGKEVFVCDVALCGRFYHLQCVSKMLVSVEQEATFIQQVKTGSEVFSCPLHKCFTCKKGDIKENESLRLYGCRRCPRAWHKQCISNKIAFYEGDFVPGIRGWEMDGMRFLYCPDHEMDEDLGTPVRDHLVFPDGSTINKSLKERKLSPKKVSLFSKQAYQTKHVNLPVSKNFLDMETAGKTGTKVIPKPLASAKKSLLGANIMKTKSFPSFNGEIKKMVEFVINESKKAVTIDTVVAKLSVPHIYKGSIGSVKKYICLGKLDSILHALAKSRECFLRGAFEEARCIFPEEFVQILERSKNKLRVYLAPILHGMRYTSYGRHFTKFGKLEEIVDRLHWYVDDGDMVVDFCCGSNDFSRLMAEKLTSCCKQCEYKNFDIIQSKHDFNFTQRDWLSVKRHELPSGDRLIMGLNPPFGVSSQLANTMVKHALTFKPKLLILIVPKETKRLEECGYQCIWEDPYLLSGQSFYFPGSVDVNDKTLSQENNDAPPLYLWSRFDWAIRHHHIAAKQGHIEKSTRITANILEPPQQICSTENSEAAAAFDTHEWSQFYDPYAAHPRDGMTHARTFDPSKTRNASSETPSGVLQKRRIEEASSFETLSHDALLTSQTCQHRHRSSSHYRTVVGSRNEGQSQVQEVPTNLHEQAEDLDIHPCEEINKQFQSPFKEKNALSSGGLRPGFENPNHKKDLHLDWPTMALPSHGNLKVYDRDFLEVGPHECSGGWIED